MKKTFLLLLLTTALTFAFSQYEKVDTNIQHKGFDFFIGGGLYFPGNKTVDFYSGVPENILNLDLLFKNEYRRNEITNVIKEKHNYIDSIWLNGYGEKPSYKMAMSISLGFKYKFNRNWGIGLMYSYSRLTAINVFFIGFPRILGTDRQELQENIAAKEERSFFDLSATYIFHPNQIVNPFLEFGLQFNYIRVKSFEVNIEEKIYSLMAEVMNPYYPGSQTMPNSRNWGAPGYGFSLAAGIKLAFSKSVSIDPMFYISACSMGHSSDLQGYNTNFGFNYAAIIRLIMSDTMFAKKQNQ